MTFTSTYSITPIMDRDTPPRFTPEQLAQGLVALLDVEEIDTDLYRGARRPGG